MVLFSIVLLITKPIAASTKIAPVEIETVIAASDAILYVAPTANPYKVRVISVIASRSKAKLAEVDLFRNPEYAQGRLEVIPGSVTGSPAILFLIQPTDGTAKWRFWTYSPAGLLNLTNGSAEYHQRDDAKATRYVVDFDFIFPHSLHPAKQDRVTESEIARTIKKLAHATWTH